MNSTAARTVVSGLLILVLLGAVYLIYAMILDYLAGAIKGVSFPAGSVAVEVAASPQARARGLTGRPSLAPGRGMLFVYRDTLPRWFTMEETLFALDIISLDDDRVVTGIARGLPGEPPFETAPARYVLEVPAGWAEDHGVTVGSRAEFLRREPDEAMPGP